MHRFLVRSVGASASVLVPLLLALGIDALARPAAPAAAVVVLPPTVVSAPPAAADS
jgi:hypothetical protein